jgi:urease gamma subunit
VHAIFGEKHVSVRKQSNRYFKAQLRSPTWTVADVGAIVILQTKHAKNISDVVSESRPVLQQLPNCDEVLQGLGHLSSRNVQMSSVQKDASPLITVPMAFALGYLVTVVREPG